MDGLKNFVRGLTFVVAAVSGGLIGHTLSGGSIWAIIGLAVVGMVIGIGVGVLFVSLLDRVARPSRGRSQRARVTPSRGPKTEISGWTLVFWATFLVLALLFLVVLTRQSIANNNLLGVVLGSLLSLIPFSKQRIITCRPLNVLSLTSIQYSLS